MVVSKHMNIKAREVETVIATAQKRLECAEELPEESRYIGGHIGGYLPGWRWSGRINSRNVECSPSSTVSSPDITCGRPSTAAAQKTHPKKSSVTRRSRSTPPSDRCSFAGSPASTSGATPPDLSAAAFSSATAKRPVPIRPSIQRGPSGGAAAEGSGSKSAGAAKESNKKVAKHTLGSEALREIGDEYAVEIEREEAHLQARAHQTLQVRLGGTLLTLLSKKESSSKDSFKDPTKSQIREIVNSWANPKSGEVSKMDFRKHVRKFVDEPDIKKVDALFGSLDADGGGTLDADELTVAMRRFHDEATTQQAAEVVLRGRIAFLRTRMASVVEVQQQTAAAEEADAGVLRLESNRLLDGRLGRAIGGKGLRLGDLVNTWEATNGEVSVKQFRRNVRTLVPDAEAEETDILFASLDADGGGTLDLDEIKDALAPLKEAAHEADSEVARLKKASVALWKAAKAAQLENQKVRRADQVKAKEQAEEEAAAAARAGAEAEAAKAAKEAKAAAARRAKEEEKVYFQAKIQSRRQTNGVLLGAAAPGGSPPGSWPKAAAAALKAATAEW